MYRCTQVVHSSRSLSSFASTSPAPHQKLKWLTEGEPLGEALSSWFSQNQPYGPLGLVLFLHSVLLNMLGEIKVQPACLSVDESTKLWSTTEIHSDCSHSNKLGLICSAWNDQEALLLKETFSHLFLTSPRWGENINICMYWNWHTHFYIFKLIS